MEIIKCARLNIQVNIEMLQSETEKALSNNLWLTHLNQRDYTGQWEVLALRSPGGNHKSIAADLMNEGEFKNTEVIKQFPAVDILMRELKCDIMAARLLNLKAGAIINPHRDHELSFENGEARIHFPIFTNPKVEFFVDDDRIDMKEGESWYINANRMHHVSNLGSTDRIHLVIDCKVNDWLTKIFDNSEKVTVEEKVNTEEIQKIINELRLQNTETSNKLADNLAATIQ